MSTKRHSTWTLLNRWVASVPGLLGMAFFAGLTLGCAAQGLTASDTWLTDIGMSWAVWMNMGYVFVALAWQRWVGRDRLAWMCVAAAVYLYGWLLAYHLLFWSVETVPGWTVWAESRSWVVAVPVACVVLGFVGLGASRSGRLGDICLALPLAWSLAEAVGVISTGWASVLLLAVPSLAVASIPLVANWRRHWDPTVFIVTTLLCSAALIALLPHLVGYIDRLR
jgi:hypothetical protein